LDYTALAIEREFLKITYAYDYSNSTKAVAMNTVSMEQMVDATRNLLSTLTDGQRELGFWASFDSEESIEERRRWFYTPTDHGGVTLHQLTPDQHRMVFRLLRSGLSRPGYVTLCSILGHDNVLDELEGFTRDFGHDRTRDPGRYYVRIFGEPGVGHWGWRFGGHHISINFTLHDATLISNTPCFLGADPASSPLLGGHTLRPLGATEDLGRELFASLDTDQRARAILSEVAPSDLVTANRATLRDGDTALPLRDVWRGYFHADLDRLITGMQTSMDTAIGTTAQHLHELRYTTKPRGISVAAMSAPQRALVRSLLDTYIGRVREDLAEIEMRRYEGSAIESISFAWAGGTQTGQAHYFRLQGDDVLAEYDNSARNANHVHTVWRDPRGDFGDSVFGHIVKYHS
jgi:Protein of unknown function (DUF3500)